MCKIAARLRKSTSMALTRQPRVRFDYFSLLPGEIRNEIMRLVLVPGVIHIRAREEGSVEAKMRQVWQTVRSFPKGQPEIPRPPSLPGFQVLATCKALYGENHEMFYSSNTFFLPPGWLGATFTHFLNNLQAEHENMIIRVGIKVGIEDLTPAVLAQVLAEMSKDIDDALAPTFIAGYLTDIWRAKFSFLRSARGLKKITLATDDEMLEMDGGAGLEDELQSVEVKPGVRVHFYLCAEEVDLIEREKMKVKMELEDRMEREGWKALIAWVKAGGYQAGRG